MLVGLSRMKRILEVDLDNGWMRVQPGVINLDVSKHISPNGYYYAPDPSSQSVCSIGGNVAENSGGAHCLKYGFTVNHVLAARLVTYDGTVVDLGSAVADTPGFDLLGVLVGSEGLVGIVTEVTLRILRKPEATRTFFATFPSTTEAGNCVSEIIGSGIIPAAIEMMDRLAIEAAKAATGVDWPDVGAALLMDVDGPLAETEHTSQKALQLAKKTGALEVRVPKDEGERLLMWKGRKSAFAAVGRISPELPRPGRRHPAHGHRRSARRDCAPLARLGRSPGGQRFPRRGRKPPPAWYFSTPKFQGKSSAPRQLGGEILRICLRHGGSITGEHGVGRRQAAVHAEDVFRGGPRNHEPRALRLRPGAAIQSRKSLPHARLCGDRPGVYRPQPAELSGLAERV